ncbi:MAG: diadenylate cyclase CdaA [Deltaproteobacteria bacterium]|nr:diadenylate cyclase CdaA [Candidatus Anaeroferrophillus wilburensis]MBN2888272.1 diadenylate cyclase CdaA [Deltaproteobacteria bacterium]
MVDIIYNLRWQDILDIVIVAFLIYHVLLIIRGTRAFQILLGLFLIFIIYEISLYLGFYTLHWIINGFLSSIILIIIVLFQNEIRRALAKFGKTSFSINPSEEHHYLEETVKACLAMSLKRVGALIVFARENKMPNIIEGGVQINAEISDALLLSIFNPSSPLHDGAVIIIDGQIVAAGCFLPLTTNPLIDKNYGTRHRAAIGITEDSDAVVIVVSEETGTISLAMGGKITRGQDAESLHKVLTKIFMPSKRNKGNLSLQGLRDLLRIK